MHQSPPLKRPLVLGSTSRYRRELLERLNLPFDVTAPEVDETPLPGEAPRSLALRLALAKARAVAQLHPDAVVIGMIDSKLNANKEAAGFIFDGFPRTVNQANALDAFLKNRNTEISMMLALNVDEDELVKRLLIRGKDSGRADDSDESIIRNRIKVYNEQTAIAAEYYNQQGKYHGINGIGSIDEIFNRLSAIIVESNR